MRSALSLIIFQLLTIPLVILIFKLPYEKQVLSLVASSLFFTAALGGLLYWRARRAPLMSILLHLVFILFFALPIIGLRLYFWNISFDDPQVAFLGIEAGQFHKGSSWAYLLMLAGSAFAFYKTRLQPHKSGNSLSAVKTKS